MFGHRRQTACERIQEMFSPYIDGRATAVERDAVDFHVEVCEDCRYEIASQKTIAQLLHRMPVVSAPRSFTLAEAPARGFELPFTVPSMNWLRVAAAAAVITLVTMVGLDLTGAIDKSGEPVVSSPSPTVTPDDQPALPENSPQPTQGDEGIDALPPDPEGDDPESHIAKDAQDNPIPEVITVDESVSGPPDAPDPRDGEGEGLSPTPPPHSPSWLLPVEIVSGVLVAIIGATYLLVWRKKRGFSSIRRG